MKKILLSAGLSILSLCAACGGGGPAVRPVGNFSNSSLSGQYAYQIKGYEFTTAGSFFLLEEAGVFSADGNGHITAGTDDYQGATSYSTGSVTGTYTITNDGTGQILINTSDGGILDLSVTMASSNKVYLQVAQTTQTANGSGVAEKQNPAAFTSVPSGTFVFLQHKFDSTSSTAISQAGIFSAASGVLTGTSDLNLSGALTTATVTGTLTAPDGNGRGTGSLQNSSGSATNFAYYVVDANNLRFYSIDNGILGLGRAEMQSSTALSNASLNGGYAFGSRGDDFSSTGGIDGVNTVGRFSADGAGNISAGTYDSVQDGNTANNIPFNTGSYTVNSSTGRAAVTLNLASGGTVQQFFWLVSPSRAFLVTDDPNKIEDGTIDAQQSTSFSNSSLKGQFAFFMSGFNLNLNTLVDRVGTLQWDGSGNLTLAEFVNNSGNVGTSGSLPGSYSVSSNGRVVSSVNSLSGNLIFYLTSGTDGYILQNDSGVEIFGHMTAQP